MLELNDKFQFIGFYDPSDENAKVAIESFNIKRFDSIDELLDEVDCVDIVTPTLSHFDCASKALRKSKHVFIEKPVTETVNEAKILINLSHRCSSCFGFNDT